MHLEITNIASRGNELLGNWREQLTCILSREWLKKVVTVSLLGLHIKLLEKKYVLKWLLSKEPFMLENGIGCWEKVCLRHIWSAKGQLGLHTCTVWSKSLSSTVNDRLSKLEIFKAFVRWCLYAGWSVSSIAHPLKIFFILQDKFHIYWLDLRAWSAFMVCLFWWSDQEMQQLTKHFIGMLGLQIQWQWLLNRNSEILK